MTNEIASGCQESNARSYIVGSQHMVHEIMDWSCANLGVILFRFSLLTTFNLWGNRFSLRLLITTLIHEITQIKPQKQMEAHVN